MRVALLLMIMLSGCVSQPPVGQNHWLWQLSGRAVFQGPDQRESASILWQTDQQRDHVQLSGPFGQGAVRLISDSEGATLWQDGEPRASDVSAEALLFRHLQWQVPIAALKYWVRGETAPLSHSDIIKRETFQQFSQSGWRVTQSKFTDDGLPRKVIIEQPPYKLTLLIAKWN